MPLDDDRGPRAGPRPRRRFPVRPVFLLLSPLVLAAALVVLWLGGPQVPESAARGLAWDDDTRRAVQALVETRYADPITRERAEELFDGAMKGYVGELDPFSRYFTVSERTLLDEDTSGTFGGIGVQVRPVPEGLLLTAVRIDGPADHAGLEPGDVVEKVGTSSLTGRDLDQMVNLIKGKAGTDVEITFRRGGGGARTVQVRRAIVDLDTVPAVRFFEGAPPVGYVRIDQFSDTTPAEVRRALQTLVHQGATALVLDLRQNRGGVVSAAVDVAALLLPQGTLVCVTRTREGARAYHTERKADFEPLDLPLVVLVDGQSASASEILAGAFQDHGRAVLVGERTYGKFLVQSIVDLNRRGAALRLTTARYETPRGRSAQRDPARNLLGGLLPDVRVPLGSKTEEDALRMTFALQAGPQWRALPERQAPPHRLDAQLKAALDLLRGAPPPAEPVPPRVP